jgi:HD-like signal output (HDOD) protein
LKIGKDRRELLKFDFQTEYQLKRTIGMDHAKVGACLLEAWNLPVRLLNAVRYHHCLKELSETSGAVNLVHIADAN